MRKLLLAIAICVTMCGTIEAKQKELLYVRPVPVYYSWVGGFTAFPQYPLHQPAYYTWPTIIVKEKKPTKFRMLGDLPQYH